MPTAIKPYTSEEVLALEKHYWRSADSNYGDQVIRLIETCKDLWREIARLTAELESARKLNEPVWDERNQDRD
jgi:hypothetical protein